MLLSHCNICDKSGVKVRLLVGFICSLFKHLKLTSNRRFTWAYIQYWTLFCYHLYVHVMSVCVDVLRGQGCVCLCVHMFSWDYLFEVSKVMPALQVRHHGNGSDESGPASGWGCVCVCVCVCMCLCMCVDSLYMDIRFCGSRFDRSLCVCVCVCVCVELVLVRLTFMSSCLMCG